MKTRHLQSVSLILTLSALPFVGGCGQQSSNAPATTNASALPTAPLLVTAAVANTSAPVIGESQPMPVPSREKTIPANVKPSAPASEIIRLANAGVEESVMLAFVNSSQSAFNLGPDEIIYLSDLGVAESVVTAMIERDQVLKQPWSPPIQVAATTEISNVPPETEEQPVAAAPTYVNPPEAQPVEQPTVINYNSFYNDLGSYGSWVQVDGYGLCWQPTVVIQNRNWRPYCDRGRWIYTDCGWYWQSDYSWGGTFHYGRWFNHPSRGWCWWPDRTWGPSWVTWRYNDSYCGWAPLPPRCYYRPGFGLVYARGLVGIGISINLPSDCITVSWGGFRSRNPARHCLPAAQTAIFVRTTTPVNDFGTRSDGTVINRGVAPERVAQATHIPVHRVSVRYAESRTAMTRQSTHNVHGSQALNARQESSLDTRSTRTAAARNESGNNHMRGESLAFANTPSSSQQSQSGAFTPTENVNANPRGGRGDNNAQPGRPETRTHASPPWINRGNTGDQQSQEAATPAAPAGSLILNGNRNDSPARTANRPAQSIAPRAPQQNGSQSSLVVIGRPNPGQTRGQIYLTQPSGGSPAGNQDGASVPAANFPPQTGPAPQVQSPMVNRTHTWSSPVQSQTQQGSPQFNQRQPNRIENRPSGPVTVNRQYTPPAAPTFSPPASRPATPQYRSAPVQRPAPPVVAPQPRMESPRIASPRAESVPRSYSPPASNPGRSSSDNNGGGGGHRR